MKAIDTLVIDKTGTLTEGKPKVVSVIPADGFEANELLRLAASVEQGSEHPLAQAILNAAKERQLALADVGGFASPSGKGATGTVDGRTVALGNAMLMGELNIATTALDAATEAARIARIGYAQGKFGQLELLEAERTLAETRQSFIEALVALHLAEARLARLTTPSPENAGRAQ